MILWSGKICCASCEFIRVGNEVSTNWCIVCQDLLSVDDSWWQIWHKWLCKLFWIHVILLVVMKNIGLLPSALSKPCVRHLNSLLNAPVQIWLSTEPLAISLFLEFHDCFFVKDAKCQWQCDQFVHYFLKRGELCYGLAQKNVGLFLIISQTCGREFCWKSHKEFCMCAGAVRFWWVVLHNVLHCCLCDVWLWIVAFVCQRCNPFVFFVALFMNFLSVCFLADLDGSSKIAEMGALL